MLARFIGNTYFFHIRKLHRLCVYSKWNFVGNTSNKARINPLLVILYQCFSTTKTLFTTTLLFVEYIYGFDIYLIHLLHVKKTFIYFDTLECHYIKCCCILKLVEVSLFCDILFFS